MNHDRLELPSPSYASQPDGLSPRQDQQEIGATDLTSRKETVQPASRSDTAVLIDEGFASAFPGRGEAIRQKYDQIAAKQGEPLAADWLGGVPTARPDVRQTLQDILGSGAAGAGQPAQDLIQLADATATIIERPQEKQDAKLSIRDDTVTISAKIYLYGSGATQEVAEAYEQDIEAAWDAGPSGKRWQYTDPETGKEYAVRFTPDVALYDPKDPSRTPSDAAGHSTPPNTDNFIEVDTATARSYVRGGDRGEWRGTGRGGRSLEEDNPAAHEFGHLLGLPDRYTEGGGAQKRWAGNIMAEPAGRGTVEQRDIDAIVTPHIEAYAKSGTKPGEPFVSYIDP